MYQKMFDDKQNLFSPMSKIFQANVEAMDRLREVQSRLASELINESVNHLVQLSKPANKSFDPIAAQQEYWQRISEKYEASIDKSCRVLSEAQSDVNALLVNDDNPEQAKPAKKAKTARTQKPAPRTSVTTSETSSSPGSAQEENQQEVKIAKSEVKESAAKSTRRAKKKAVVAKKKPAETASDI